VELRESSNLTRVTGVARDRSFLTGGQNNAVDLSYLENFGLGMRRIEASSVLRYTDDRRVDPEHSSVQRAYFRITGPHSEYNLGDYLVSYSRLTYNQNVKGLHFIRTVPWGNGFRLLGNAGAFTDRYGSLFKEDLPGKPLTRVVSGLRAEQKIAADKTIGLNWAYGNDSAALSSQVAWQGSYRRTNDGLRGENRNPETVFQLPEFRFSFRDLPGLGSSLLDVGYRQRMQEQGRIADRVTRSPFVEVGIPISSTVLTLGFEHRANVDRFRPTNQTSTNDASVTFRGVFNVGDWQVTPLLRYQHNREAFDRVETGNNTRSLQAALILDAPKYFTFEAMYRQLGATLFQDQPLLDPTTLQPRLGPTGLPAFAVTGPSGFRRPALRMAVTYKLFNDENRFFTLSYERNNNLFALAGQVVWRLRRQ